jgi:hypothetical protein
MSLRRTRIKTYKQREYSCKRDSNAEIEAHQQLRDTSSAEPVDLKSQVGQTKSLVPVVDIVAVHNRVTRTGLWELAASVFP